MAIWDENSHIPGSSILELSGLDTISTAHNSTLNIQQSFTYGIMLQPIGEPTVQLDYALLTKGSPTSPTEGSISIEAIGGKVRVYLHSGVNSLVIESVGVLLNTKQIKHLAVVWDYTLKDFDMYLDGVPVATTVVTGGSNYATMSLMGLINTNTSNMTFAYAAGKNNANIRIFHEFLSPTAWSPSKIANLYDSIKYLGTYPPQPTIIFSSDRSGTYEIHTMSEDGTEPERQTYSGWSLMFPKWSESGDYFSFRNYSTSSLSGIINPYYGPSNHNQFIPNYASRFSPGTLISVSSPSSNSGVSNACTQIMDNTQAKIYYSEYNHTIAPGTSYPSIISKPFPALGTATLFKSSGTSYGDNWGIPFFCFSFDNLYCFYVYEGTSTNSTSKRLYRRTIAGGAELLIEGNTNGKSFYNVQCNRQSTKIAYSLQDINNFYQVWVRDLDGSNAQQLTFDLWNNYCAGFSADGLQVIFNSLSPTTAKYQIYLINVDGTRRYNISNNNYNDYYGDSMILP